MKIFYKTEDLPKGNHRIALVTVQSSYALNTGHMKYIHFDDDEELKNWIIGQHGKESFILADITPVEYTINVSISTDKKPNKINNLRNVRVD